MEKIIEIEELKLKRALKSLNRFKRGAYINLKGIINAKVTFYKFYAKIDNKKITITDSLKDDIMTIDVSYISKIRQSADKKKLELNLENEEIVTIEI